ncbi:MAG: helix-turn-helix domain-containing protein [Rhodospirillaceae bacterium]|nr:helix-turn-helix domain-containing protein [Rhodospirillaceae bacterium]
MAGITSARATFSIGALSRETGCNIETIRYYEKTGLMPAPPRTGGGHRVYADRHLKRLTFIRRGRGLGFSMDQLKGLLAMMDAGHLSCGEVANQVEVHLLAVRQRLDALGRLEQILSETLTKCHRGDRPDCPIIDALQGLG